MTQGNALVVVNHPRDFPWEIPGVSVVSAREYLTDDVHCEKRSTQVINLCRYDRYQSRGYYVSLLAEARGHRALPEMKSVGDLQGGHLGALARPDFEDDLQRHLAQHAGDCCIVDVTFGLDAHRRYDALAAQVFARMPVPLLRVR